MSKRSISFSSRSVVGKGSARKLKQEGLVPAVVYQRGTDSLHVALNAKEINKELKIAGFMTHLFELKSEGKSILATVSEVALHPVKDEILHVDFSPVSADGMVKIAVPVHIKGKEISPGCKKGGVISIPVHNLRILCPVKSLIEEVVIDVSNMEIHSSVTVKDLILPKGAKVVGLNDDFVLISIVGKAKEEQE